MGGSSPERLTSFFKAAESIGTCRFVVQGEEAILECLGSFKNMRSSVNPKSGKELITFSSETIPVFECHLRVDEIVKVMNVQVQKDKNLHISSFAGHE